MKKYHLLFLLPFPFGLLALVPRPKYIPKFVPAFLLHFNPFHISNYSIPNFIIIPVLKSLACVFERESERESEREMEEGLS